MTGTDPEADRARFILEEQQAILRDTPFNRGCIAATAEYIRALEPEPEIEP
jgi:hypothetical protein